MFRELADLREELKGGGRHSLMPAVSAYTPPSKNNKKRVTIAVERYKEDELDELWSEEDESSEDEDSDDEWRKTPMFKRIRKERQSLAVPEKRKRRSSAFLEEDEKPEINEDSSSKKKRGSASGGCTCKGGCQNKRCSCKKAGPFCSALCKCPANKCANREVPGDDVSDASCMSTDMEASDLEVSVHNISFPTDSFHFPRFPFFLCFSLLCCPLFLSFPFAPFRFHIFPFSHPFFTFPFLFSMVLVPFFLTFPFTPLLLFKTFPNALNSWGGDTEQYKPLRYFSTKCVRTSGSSM